MKITFVYIDDPNESEEVNIIRRRALTVSIRMVAEKEMRGERFEQGEPRLTDLGALLVRERIGYLLCQLHQ